MPTLIETEFPFAQLSRIAEHESWRKEIYRPAYYLHKWWARRLGSVFRGIILGAGLDSSADFWERFYGVNNFDDISLFDPFMGSGVTIGEGIKLGCRAAGRDINAVAATICKAAFSHYDALEVDATYRAFERNVAPKLRTYFETRTAAGEPATVLYYFMVKVVECPTCNLAIDLFKNRIFSANAVPSKDPTAHAICPACGMVVRTRYDASEACCDHCRHLFNPRLGVVTGAQVNCPHCHRSFKLVDRMKDLPAPLDCRRYAKMVLTDDGYKIYEPLNDFDRNLEQVVADEYLRIVHTLPRVSVEPGYNTNQMLKHNYRYWHELFSDRHVLCIVHLVEAIRSLEDPDIRRLFASLFSGTLEFNNLFASFKGEGTGAVRHMFANHVLKPELMPIEANLWGTNKSSGAFSTLYRSRVQRALEYKANPTEVVIDMHPGAKRGGINRPLSATVVESYEEFSVTPGSVYLSQGDSSHTDLPDGSVDLVVSDPPFFDNVHYSQLADFFYYWLNQVLELSSEQTTRRASEVQDTDAHNFTTKLTAVFTECERVLKDQGLFVFTYHHARHDGWMAVHRAMRRAGFSCIRAYPIKAEMLVSMPLQQAKSPIHFDLILVCRKNCVADTRTSTGDPTHQAVRSAEAQVNMLKGAGIEVSLADAKVILMGQLVCEAHRMHNLEREEAFLQQRELDIDSYVGSVLKTNGEVLYSAAKVLQLALFEEMAEYLTHPELEAQSLRKSADLYAEIYASDHDLQDLTEAAQLEWPEP